MNARIARESVLFLAFLLGGTLGGPALSSSGQVSAQADSFRARLSPLPVTGGTFRTTTGLGQVRATLDGNRLTVTGTYRGMSSPATAAHLHFGAPGRPGPLAQPLEVTASPEGEVSGTAELTNEQVAALQAQSLYVQIHSEGNPLGELRGWIFGIETMGEVAANTESESLTVADLTRGLRADHGPNAPEPRSRGLAHDAGATIKLTVTALSTRSTRATSADCNSSGCGI